MGTGAVTHMASHVFRSRGAVYSGGPTSKKQKSNSGCKAQITECSHTLTAIPFWNPPWDARGDPHSHLPDKEEEFPARELGFDPDLSPVS